MDTQKISQKKNDALDNLYIRPAWIIDRRILEDTLENDFLCFCNEAGSNGCAILYCPSLETFDPYENQGIRPLEKMWVDTYGGKYADIVLLVPWTPSSGPPDWFGVQHLINLVYWLSKNEKELSESSLPKRFGKVAERIQVLLCNLDTMTAGSGKSTIDYAFGIYFHPYSFGKLNEFFKQAQEYDLFKGNPAKPELMNDLVTKQVQLILGTSIGKPFSSFNNGRFTYNLLLRFNRKSAVPKPISDKISCVVLEHMKLVVEAFKGRCPPGILPGYLNEYSKLHGVTLIENSFMSFWDFLSLTFLQIGLEHEKLKFIKPNSSQNDLLVSAKRAAMPCTESTDTNE